MLKNDQRFKCRRIYTERLRNRIAQIMVIDPVTQKIALQVRAKNVFWEPLHIGAAVCGHVEPSETALQAAQRELKEELGVETPLVLMNKGPYDCPRANHPYMLYSFFAQYPTELLRYDQREVEELLFVSKEELAALIQSDRLIHNLFLPIYHAFCEYSAVFSNRH
jgi:8-oxo-dGTP pyrophosphatase MutT (NUDIX family)